MIASVRFTRSAALVAGVISLLVTVPAGAQRSAARAGVAVPAPRSGVRAGVAAPPRSPISRIFPGTTGGVLNSRSFVDPLVTGPTRFNNRFNNRIDNRRFNNRRFRRNFLGSQFVVPFDGFGYYDGYCGASCVTDANGRPLTQNYEDMQSPPPSVTYEGVGYTPDLTGSPYAISDEGMMVVEFPNGERRAFPSCAQQGDLRDPQGRPRTIFYHQTDYWMILRPGQRGRVQGEQPASNAKACYAIDATGNVVLRH
jgi:hypothetical protein